MRKNINYLYILCHVVGLLGLSIPIFRKWFQFLVPFHLVLMTILVIVQFKGDKRLILKHLIVFFLLGYIIEVLGIYSQIIFGSYQYGSTLGIKIFNVPLTMGLNWFLLVFSIGDLTQNFKISKPFKILIASSLMIFIDFFIEPIAQFLDFWHWENQVIPFQNYTAWLMISLLFFTIYFRKPLPLQHPNGTVLFACQCLFFIFLRLICI